MSSDIPPGPRNRLPGWHKVRQGHLYYGFECPDCKKDLCYLEAPSGATLKPLPILPGHCLIACWYCNKDGFVVPWERIKLIVASDERSVNQALEQKKPTYGTRKPLANRYPLARATFGPHAVAQRPECAVIIARIIASWSYIDVEVGLLLSQMLDIGRDVAFAMFLSVKQSRVQNDMVRAAAATALNKEDLALLNALFSLKDQYQKDRDDLAHGLFGAALDVKDGILWQKPIDSIRYTATVWHSQYQDFNEKQNVFVYESSELEGIAAKILWMCEQINGFRGYLTIHDAITRLKRYRTLCAEPRTAEEMRRLAEAHHATRI